MPAFPLSVNLDTIALSGFSSTDVGDNSQAIRGYDGCPLYCHADEDVAGTGNVAITVDEFGPSSFWPKPGPITRVSVSYTDVGGHATTITWSAVPNGTLYKGRPLFHYLDMAPDLSRATLRIIQPTRGASTANSIGLVVLGRAVTGGAPVGIFVNVPLMTTNAPSITSMDIHWGPPGSMAGPIGSGVIPPGGP